MSDLAKTAARRVKPADRSRSADGVAAASRRGNRLPRDERRGQLLIVASDVFVDHGYRERRPDAPYLRVRSLREAAQWIMQAATREFRRHA